MCPTDRGISTSTDIECMWHSPWGTVFPTPKPHAHSCSSYQVPRFTLRKLVHRFRVGCSLPLSGRQKHTWPPECSTWIERSSRASTRRQCTHMAWKYGETRLCTIKTLGGACSRSFLSRLRQSDRGTLWTAAPSQRSLKCAGAR